MTMAWTELTAAARAVLHPRRISEFVEVGGAAAAILTDRGNVYVGICIDTACSLGMCAERNAAARMLTDGESVIARMVCLNSEEVFLPPCGACREFLLELSPRNADLEVMLSPSRVVKLKELLPDWWGEKNQHDSPPCPPPRNNHP